MSYSCWPHLVLHALYAAPGLLDASLPHSALPHAPVLPVAGVVHLGRGAQVSKIQPGSVQIVIFDRPEDLRLFYIMPCESLTLESLKRSHS